MEKFQQRIDAKNFSAAVTLFEKRFKGREHECDIDLAHDALDSYGRSGNYKGALELFQLIIPSTESFFLVMLACASAKRWDEVIQLISKQDAAGLPLKSRALELRIRAHAELNDYKTSVYYLRELVHMARKKQTGYQDPETSAVDLRILTSVINCCARACAREGGPAFVTAFDAFELVCGSNGPDPDVFTMAALMSACDKVRVSVGPS